MSAYDEGSEAFFTGDLLDTNPYDPSDAQHEEWNEGYIDADAEESGEFEPIT